ERKVDIQAATSGRSVRMPAGPVLAALYDANGNAIALAQPVQLDAGKRVTISPKQPDRGAGAVLLSLQRPHGSYSHSEVTLDQGGNNTPPDVLHESAERVIAIWYSVRGGSATLRFRGPGLPDAPMSLSITEGNVTTVRTKVAERGGS